MAFVRIMVHAVWGTKNHFPFLNKEIRQTLISHIKANAKSKRLYIDSINGSFEHVHCLISLNADMNISKAIQLIKIKGESSNWINKQKLTQTKFEWADEYYAVSINESSLQKVRDYIENQEEHHRKVNFTEEYEKVIQQYKKIGD